MRSPIAVSSTSQKRYGDSSALRQDIRLMMQKFRLGFLLALLALILIFVLQNVATVEVQFLFWSLALPRSLMILIVLGIGVVIGWFLKSSARKPRI